MQPFSLATIIKTREPQSKLIEGVKNEATKCMIIINGHFHGDSRRLG